MAKEVGSSPEEIKEVMLSVPQQLPLAVVDTLYHGDSDSIDLYLFFQVCFTEMCLEKC
jgi:hypothetical protein